MNKIHFVLENLLATGATNGAVVTWNLRNPARSKLDCVFKDHERTVNKVLFVFFCYIFIVFSKFVKSVIETEPFRI